VVLTLPMTPSANNLYVRSGRGAKGGVHLTDVAKQYANAVKDVVSQNMHVLKADFSDIEATYSMDVTAYFPELENAGWFERYTKGAKVGERKAATRYKVIDVDNRVKFAQDCACKALGIPNDCQVFEGAQRKKKGKERVVLRIKRVNPQWYLEDG